ncbi:PREDICTED: uncharacterized protein LOC104609786 [Nelumbo nucifera]|uniref:GH10 domain-containing protein n=2 Tax=Nelumbo nucifera TaxID=4432 RepID=A0A822ZES7_NELNU|nr:PREDICTED: uncharacterized protein LOC104609786 [Nelumbo nucifera]DAD41506.1 TPA_asm: hypothetical protein HUJ06_015829 [Nelumbo nucifera]
MEGATDGGKNLLLFLFCLLLLLLTGSIAEGLSYDYSASIECLVEPHRPQYEGGIIVNPEFNHGLRGWSIFGSAKIEQRVSEGGNSFIVAHSRKQPHDSISQKFYLRKGNLYTLSAWIQVSQGKVPVRAVFKTKTGYKHAGAVITESGCWSMLKGGLTANSSGPAELYFESENKTVDIWVDSVSLQPFTIEQWRAHQEQSIEKTRKRKVKFQAVDSSGKTLTGAQISIHLKKPSFPFGAAIAQTILHNPTYQKWFTSRFTVTTFENEMKWYSTENSPGKENYSVADAMLQFTRKNGIRVRGHNVFWDDPKYQPWWVPKLSYSQLNQAAWKRINSIMSRYKGQVIAWDVVNENLHFSFFEDRLGRNASAAFYKKAHQLDDRAIMFLNEYNTIEDSRDGTSSPAKYIQKLKEIQSYAGGRIPLGIGLQGHFNTPDIAYMRSALDTLAATKLPIWITELDVEGGPNQAKYLEEILREAHSHPAIKGIVIWGAWPYPEQCRRMCLTDNNFKNLPTGNVVDKLIGEWTHASLAGLTDSNGYFETSLFHGDYVVTITHPSMNSSLVQSFKVTTPGVSQETMLDVKI